MGDEDGFANRATDAGEEVTHLARCATCGSRIDSTSWHPVTTRVDDDGDFHLYAFCSVPCRDEYRDE